MMNKSAPGILYKLEREKNSLNGYWFDEASRQWVIKWHGFNLCDFTRGGFYQITQQKAETLFPKAFEVMLKRA